MFAVRDGYHEIARILIGNGALVNFKDAKSKTPMYLAAYHSRPKVGDLLLENYADTDGPFLMASSIKMMDFLFERGADVDTAGSGRFYGRYHGLAGRPVRHLALPDRQSRRC